MSASLDVVIESRFRGPDGSGNGGYVCGVLAEHVNGSAEVTLRSPPPLDECLRLTVDDDEIVGLYDHEQLVASARPADLSIEAPAPPSLAEAEAAQSGYVGFDHHPYPGCFVCGPQRQPNDGLRIFPGAIANKPIVAAHWRPGVQWQADDGLTRAEIIWAALDCPSYFGLQSAGLMALLGRMTATVHRCPPPETDCIVVGWRLRVDGRKHFAGSALYDNSGQLLAAAKTVWIAIS